MWLRRLVGLVMIVTCLGMIGIVVVGIFSTDKQVSGGLNATVKSLPPVMPPTVTISADPGSIAVGSYSALKWSTTANPESCTATGSWSGQKTAYGSESTGRVTQIGTLKYIIDCKNSGGSASASVSVSVVAADAVPVNQVAQTGTSSSATTTASYCGGRIPCYGASEVVAHSGAGNCWGWNGDRVVNISGLDLGFHKAKTGISTIEVSQVCGRDLAPSLRGEVSAGGQTRNHNESTKSNSDRNEISYFVGYFDGNKK